MANDTTKVTVGKGKVGGYFYYAPSGTTPPSDASTALANTYKCLGFISEDGVRNSNERDNTTIKDWNGDSVLLVNTGMTDTWSTTLIEVMNMDVLKVVFGASNVSGALATGITVKANNYAQEAAVFVFEMVFNGNVLHRVVLPNAYVSEVGEITYAAGQAVGFPITLTAAVDANGNSHYEYTKEAGT